MIWYLYIIIMCWMCNARVHSHANGNSIKPAKCHYLPWIRAIIVQLQLSRICEEMNNPEQRLPNATWESFSIFWASFSLTIYENFPSLFRVTKVLNQMRQTSGRQSVSQCKFANPAKANAGVKATSCLGAHRPIQSARCATWPADDKFALLAASQLQ